MKERYVSEGVEDVVARDDGVAEVSQGLGYSVPGLMRCRLVNTGNGYIAWFPSHQCTRQDYYVCLDYAQARDLVLALSMFKEELGFV